MLASSSLARACSCAAFSRSSTSIWASSLSTPPPSPSISTTARPPDEAALLKQTQVLHQVLNRVSTIPGVQAAGIVDYLPLGQNRSWGLPFPKGVEPPKEIDSEPLVYVVTPGYMRAMGTAIRGRDFTWDDTPKSTTVVMINKAYARFLASYAKWPDNSAVGQMLHDGKSDMLVAGVVDDVHEEGTEGDTGWQIYYPVTQNFPNSAQLVIRTSLPPASLATSVLSALRELNPKQPAAEFRPIQSLVDHANSPRRFFMLLVAAFGTLGLLLAALGIYGVISYSVTRQTQEIGIRMALGASAGLVQRHVLANTLRLAVIGVVIGAGASLLLTRLIASLLFGTSPSDLLTYIGMAVALLTVAAVSGYIPARRASRINPTVALRAN